MTNFTLRFLGKFEGSIGAEPITDFHSDKARALLAYLAIEPKVHTRPVLAALLWPEIGDKYARTNLRNTLYRLRQTLDATIADSADQLLTVTRQTVQCNTANGFIDVQRLETLLDDASAQRPIRNQIYHLLPHLPLRRLALHSWPKPLPSMKANYLRALVLTMHLLLKSGCCCAERCFSSGHF